MRLSSRILLIAALIVTLAVGIWHVMPLNHTYAISTRAVIKTSTTPITHAVFIMLENHTFDNFFGSYTCPTGDANCDTVNGVTLPQATDPFPSDYNHGSEAAYAAIDGGKMDGFEAHAYYQYKQSDIPIYWYYAQRYGLGDKFFTSYATSSTPNHISMFAAQSGGIFETTQQKGCTSQANDLVHSINMNDASIHYWQPPCVNIPTLDPSLSSAGLTWKFFCDVPIWCAPKMISSLYKSPNNVPDSQFIPDIYNKKNPTTCTLPNVSWVTPTGISTDHPPSLVEPAQNTLNGEVKAIMHSPCWQSTAIFLSWDDWGGEYDHIAPPAINSQGPGLGMRVPLIVISPYSKPGYVSHQVSEFSSFVKFVESNFNLPNLGARDAFPAIGDLMDYFDFSQSPQPPPSDLPTDFPTLNLDMLHVPSQGLGLGISGTLNPIIGGTNTQYTYSVVFTPSATNITAATAQVIIDGTAYPMVNSGKTSGGGNGIPGGTLYTYTPTPPLGIGIHTYSFSFTDSTNATQVLPHNGVPFNGPEVHSFTLNAATSSVTSSPTLPGQPVKYTVTYTSPSNIAPTRSEVIIDGVPFLMKCTDKKPNYTKGAHYAYTAPSLSTGVHYAIFQFDDGLGDGEASYPGRITPIVTPVLLSNSSVSFSGSTATFQTTFSDESGNAPTQAYVYVNNTPYTMTCSSNCGPYSAPGATFKYPMSLPSGKYTYFFVFSDGNSSWGDPVGPNTYSINCNPVCTLGASINQMSSNQDNDSD